MVQGKYVEIRNPWFNNNNKNGMLEKGKCWFSVRRKKGERHISINYLSDIIYISK